MVSITPVSLGSVNIQSSATVFPLAIFKGNENRDELKEKLQPLINEFADVRSVGDHQIEWLTVTDLKAAWEFFSLPKGSCVFCNCTTVSDRSEISAASKHHTFERKIDPSNVLFPTVAIHSKYYMENIN